jgi:hypothetical protein
MRFLTLIILAGLLLAGGWQSAYADEPAKPQLWPLEGQLKIHPKFLYRYYIVFGDGQKCALYGPDHAQEFKQLADVPRDARIRVRGTLGTSYFAGGAEKNPSPFPQSWTLYMDVHEVEVIGKVAGAIAPSAKPMR